MKKSLIVGMFYLVLTQGVGASCLQDYKSNYSMTAQKIKDSNINRNKYIGISTAAGFVVSTVASLPTTGGMLVSTYGGSGLVGPAWVGDNIFKFLNTEDELQLMQNEKALSESIQLLNNAYVGKGPLLEQSMPSIWRTISTDISLDKLAKKIQELDEGNEYCSNGEISTPRGMIYKAASALTNK